MYRYFFTIIQKEFTGILLSYLFVFAIIGLSTIMQKKKLLSGEGSRKMIHILLCNWWILAMMLFKSNIAASIGPLSFVIINYISYKKKLFGAMERGGGKEDLGTVYYAISLLILALVTFSSWSTPVTGAFGILIMGYGDGMAAVIGKRFGRKKIRIWGGEKSLEGSLTMFIISFITACLLYSIFYRIWKFYKKYTDCIFCCSTGDVHTIRV